MNTEELFQTAMDTVERVEQSKTYPTNPRFLHAIMGIANESGELMELVKSKMYYNKKYTYNEVIEELGDAFYYFTLAILAMAEDDMVEVGADRGKSPTRVLEDVIRVNEAKLLVRYPNGYSNAGARVRNIVAEYQAIAKVTGRE